MAGKSSRVHVSHQMGSITHTRTARAPSGRRARSSVTTMHGSLTMLSLASQVVKLRRWTRHKESCLKLVSIGQD